MSLKRMDTAITASFMVKLKANSEISSFFMSLHAKNRLFFPSTASSSNLHFGRALSMAQAEGRGMMTVRSERVSLTFTVSRYRSTGAQNLPFLRCRVSPVVLIIQYYCPKYYKLLLWISSFTTYWGGNSPKMICPSSSSRLPLNTTMVSPMYLLYFLKLRNNSLPVFLGPKLKAPSRLPSTPSPSTSTCFTPLRFIQVSLGMKSLPKQQRLQASLRFHSNRSSALSVPQNSTIPNTLSQFFRQSGRSDGILVYAISWRGRIWSC